MKTVITILDNISPTSMPYNEFVRYRAISQQNEKQVLLLCCKKKSLKGINVPKNIEIIFVGKNLFVIRKRIREQIKKCEQSGELYMVHLHQVKSALLSEFAMFGTGFRKKVLFTVHSTFSGYAIHNKILSLLNAFFAKKIVCVSNSAYKKYPMCIKTLKANDFCSIQNGVDIQRIDYEKEKYVHKPHTLFQLIYVARMVPIKNHIFLIELMKKLDERVELVLIGQEDEDKKIRQLIQENNLQERVHLTGIISREEVFQYLLNADIYVSPSKLEGLPISVLEALYCGLPCVLSNIPQHEEIACEEDFVFLCKNDVDEWCSAINHYVNMKKVERDMLGNQAEKYIIKNFSLDSMHLQYSNIYESLMNI